jgi:transcriptional regulator with XRE-family HTH domain
MSIEGPRHLDVEIGRRIRERRRVIGMSQVQLARAIGVTFQQVQKYERGANRVSFSRLMDIVVALRCHLTDLTEGLDPTVPTHSPEHVRRWAAEEGAPELLEAYASLSNKPLRRALLEHARALAGVNSPVMET